MEIFDKDLLDQLGLTTCEHWRTICAENTIDFSELLEPIKLKDVSWCSQALKQISYERKKCWSFESSLRPVIGIAEEITIER
jgi:hypothetical protein